MLLKRVTYSQYTGTPRQWALDELALGRANLVVSENASGKTHTLNIIGVLARLLSGRVNLSHLCGDSYYSAVFSHKKKTYEYTLEYEDGTVGKEALAINGQNMLDRTRDAEGTIYSEKATRLMPFQAPADQVVAFARRDAIQHPFFQPLYDWGNSLHQYSFGGSMAKGQLGFATSAEARQPNPDARNARQIITVLQCGLERLGAPFKQEVLGDMETIGYPLEDVRVCPPISSHFEAPATPVVVCVKERALHDITDQPDMSQGMWRALCLLILLNYAQQTSPPSAVVVDDIGEGLDFRRSALLINLLMSKARRSGFQLIMATNDRFVMNEVPLRHWTVLTREPGRTRVHNYTNSRGAFEDFRFTGLNNFDFFATEYLQEAGGDDA